MRQHIGNLFFFIKIKLEMGWYKYWDNGMVFREHQLRYG